jgi:hypothetical protein
MANHAAFTAMGDDISAKNEDQQQITGDGAITSSMPWSDCIMIEGVTLNVTFARWDFDLA